MEVTATAKYIRVQPRKVRIVAREVVGKPAVMSAHVLNFHPSKSAFLLRKVLVSAMANAAENHSIGANELKIARITVDEGPKIKRMTQKAQGRGARIIKKTSHITVVVEQYTPAADIKPHGTKAKARPKFEAPKKAKAVKVEEKVVEEVKEEEVKVEDVAEAPVAEETTTEEGAN